MSTVFAVVGYYEPWWIQILKAVIIFAIGLQLVPVVLLAFGGVLLFCALTAYDMQKIKQIGSSGADGETLRKASILGARSLYLDFINMFLFLLRIFGSAR